MEKETGFDRRLFCYLEEANTLVYETLRLPDTGKRHRRRTGKNRFSEFPLQTKNAVLRAKGKGAHLVGDCAYVSYSTKPDNLFKYIERDYDDEKGHILEERRLESDHDASGQPYLGLYRDFYKRPFDHYLSVNAFAITKPHHCSELLLQINKRHALDKETSRAIPGDTLHFCKNNWNPVPQLENIYDKKITDKPFLIHSFNMVSRQIAAMPPRRQQGGHAWLMSFIEDSFLLFEKMARRIPQQNITPLRGD